MKKLLDIHKNDRPREKLQTKGPEALSDFELLQALIGSGNKQADVSEIADHALKLIQKHGANITHEHLLGVLGLGTAKATEIIAALELSRRYLISPDQPIIDTLEKAVEQLSDIRGKKQEYFVCLTLDGANRLIAKRTISIGTLTSALVHPREVFADAITDRAASIIVAHNHPSGNLNPSLADHKVTIQLKESAELLGMKLCDHVVVTKGEYRSIINL